MHNGGNPQYEPAQQIKTFTDVTPVEEMYACMPFLTFKQINLVRSSTNNDSLADHNQRVQSHADEPSAENDCQHASAALRGLKCQGCNAPKASIKEGL